MFISQYVASVRSYSSEYGAAHSCSNVCTNITGPPTVPYHLSDHQNSTAFRTYGDWWERCPSQLSVIGNSPDWFDCNEYIDLVYKNAVYPTQLHIHENYCPGTVVRVLVSNYLTLETVRENAKWITIWKGECVSVDNYSVMKIEFQNVQIPTMFIRIECNTKHSEYYTQIDAVQLLGIKYQSDQTTIISTNRCALPASPDIISTNCCALPASHDISPPITQDSECVLYCLPKELLLQILRYLLLEDLCSVSRVSRLLHYLASDQVLYRDLNLKPFYKTITNQSLDALHNKVMSLQRLDMSWVGFNGLVSPTHFSSLLKVIPHLTDLRLRCCDFVTSSVLETLAIYCTELQVLDISYCKGELGISCLAPLTHLTYLNISHTIVPSTELVALDLKQLQWFIAGSPALFADQGRILTLLADTCTNLKGIDLWYWTSLDPSSFLHLLKCQGSSLVEIDVGWCEVLSSTSNIVTIIAEYCPMLEVLRVAALREVDDPDIQSLITHCPRLKQLDILGAREVTTPQLMAMLSLCPLLEYLDISYCPLISYNDCTLLQQKYKAVKHQQHR